MVLLGALTWVVCFPLMIITWRWNDTTAHIAIMFGELYLEFTKVTEK